ncbi:TPA: hypothetical protein ACNH9H_002893 [Pseudomonas aeruginosa]
MPDMREEFEACYPLPEGVEWRTSDYLPIHTENVHEYIGRCGRASRYASMWDAWQASRAALRVELPFPIIVDEGAEFALHAYDKDETDKALQQAGIEVK